jgi:hypothetical protein
MEPLDQNPGDENIACDKHFLRINNEERVQVTFEKNHFLNIAS